MITWLFNVHIRWINMSCIILRASGLCRVCDQRGNFLIGSIHKNNLCSYISAVLKFLLIVDGTCTAISCVINPADGLLVAAYYALFVLWIFSRTSVSPLLVQPQSKIWSATLCIMRWVLVDICIDRDWAKSITVSGEMSYVSLIYVDDSCLFPCGILMPCQIIWKWFSSSDESNSMSLSGFVFIRNSNKADHRNGTISLQIQLFITVCSSVPL